MPSWGTAAWVHFLIPGVRLAAAMMAWNIRFTHAAMLEVLNEDHVRTVRAEGLSERIFVTRHSLRNAMILIVSNLGLQVAGIVSWVVLVEAVFTILGIGELIMRAALLCDFAVLQFGIIVWAVVVIVVGVADWDMYARVMRGKVLALLNAPFINALRLTGAGHFRIIFRHMLANIASPMLILWTFGSPT